MSVVWRQLFVGWPPRSSVLVAVRCCCYCRPRPRRRSVRACLCLYRCESRAGAHSFIIARARARTIRQHCVRGQPGHARTRRRAWIVRSVGELRCRAAAAMRCSTVWWRWRRAGEGSGCLRCSGTEPPTEPTGRFGFLVFDGFTRVFFTVMVVVIIFRFGSLLYNCAIRVCRVIARKNNVGGEKLWPKKIYTKFRVHKRTTRNLCKYTPVINRTNFSRFSGVYTVRILYWTSAKSFFFFFPITFVVLS